MQQGLITEYLMEEAVMEVCDGSNRVTVVGRKHGSVLAEGLWKLLSGKCGVNLDFCWNGQKSVPAHKVVLDVFLTPDKLQVSRKALPKDEGVPTVDLQLEVEEADTGTERSVVVEGTGRELDMVVEFLYRGKVSVPEESLNDLLQLARQLEIKMLVDAVQFARHSKAAAPGICKLAETTKSKASGAKIAAKSAPVSLQVAIGKSETGKLRGRPPKTTVLPLKKVIGMPPKRKPLPTRPVIKGSDSVAVGEDGSKAAAPPPRKGSSLKLAFMKCRCPHCDFETPQFDKYRRHLCSAHGLTTQGKPVRKYKCTECPYVSIYAKTLRMHRLWKHRKDKPFRCTAKDCSEAFPQKMDLIRHVNEQHSLDNGWVGCDICNRRCSSQAALAIHRETHAGEKPFKCEAPGCAFVARRKCLLQQHVDFAHGLARYLCDTCGKRCISAFTLRRHNLVHTKEKPFKCEQEGCHFAAARAETLKIHTSVVHGVGNTRFGCDRCSRRFGSHRALTVHIRKHTNEKPFNCPQCSFLTHSQTSLSKHLNVIHGQGPARIVCDECGKRCGSRAALLTHSRTHTQERPFKCELCPYSAKQKWPLTRHVEVMHGPNARPPDNKPRPFSCPHCSSSFTVRWSLQQHLDVFHVVGPSRFTCETCSKRCPSRVELIRHYRVHTGERPYSCHICNYSASQKGSLNCHLKRVHQVEPAASATKTSAAGKTG